MISASRSDDVWLMSMPVVHAAAGAGPGFVARRRPFHILIGFGQDRFSSFSLGPRSDCP